MKASMYKVDTRAVTVEVSLGAGARTVGEMFLRPSIVTLSGSESIADRLNDREAFFPLRVSAPEPATVIIGKTQVRYVMADDQPLPDHTQLASTTEAQEFDMVVELDGTEPLTGRFYALLPRGKRRALDFINDQEGLFVPFFVGARQYVLNRSFIRSLRESRA